jgi:hypothetical protein
VNQSDQIIARLEVLETISVFAGDIGAAEDSAAQLSGRSRSGFGTLA